MKLRKLVAFAAVCGTLLFVSCKKEGQDADQAHLKVVPVNSTYVVCINAKALVDKGGLAKFKDFSSYQLFKDDLMKNEPKRFKLVESLLSDTRKTGLNLDQIYAYGFTDTLTDSFVSAFSFKVDNAGKFKSTIKDLIEASDSGIENGIEEHDGYCTFRVAYSSVFVWDNDKAVLLSVTEDDYEDLSSFLKIDEANNITANVDFMEFFKVRKDVSAWIPMNSFFVKEELLGNIFSSNPSFAQMKDAKIELSLLFANEKVSLITKVWPESVMEEYYKKNDIMKSDFDASLLSYFPEKSYMAFKASYKVGNYYKMMVDGMKAYTDSLSMEEVEDEYGYHYSPYNYASILEIMNMLQDNRVAQIVGVFKGDFVGSLIDFEQGLVPMPQFALAANANIPTAIDTLVKYIPVEMKKQEDGKGYAISAGGFMNLYLTQKGEVLYFTNNKLALDAFLSDGYQKNLKDSQVGKDMLASNMYWYMNLNLDDYPALITMAARQGMGNNNFAMLSDILRTYSSFKATYDGKSTAEISLLLNSKDENSLKTIVKMIDKMASKNLAF